MATEEDVGNLAEELPVRAARFVTQGKKTPLKTDLLSPPINGTLPAPKTLGVRTSAPRGSITTVFSPGLRWRVMSSRGGSPITPPADAPLTFTAAESSGRSVHLQIDAACGQIDVGRNRHAAAERIGRLHRAGVSGAPSDFGTEASPWRVRIARDGNRLADRLRAGSIRIGRAILRRLEHQQHALQRLQSSARTRPCCSSIRWNGIAVISFRMASQHSGSPAAVTRNLNRRAAPSWF